MNDSEITIRSIQHFLYCPHRWGLLEIDKAWLENAFVTKANLMHERVHDPDRKYTLRGKKAFTSVPVYHDGAAYHLYGITDCLEATETAETKKTAKLPDGKNYYLSIVEYKPTKPKNGYYNDDDLMQVFAQKICVDYVFGGDCKAVLYYGDVKKRVELPLQQNFQEYDGRLKIILKEMRKNLQEGRIPPIQKGQKCSGCSMKDLCMPATGKRISVQKQIEEIGKEDI